MCTQPKASVLRPLSPLFVCAYSIVVNMIRASKSNMASQPRRHEVDSLRVIAFMLLIFYHIGMYYVADWGWHIKSRHQSEWLQYPMIFLNQWRMPLIFFISGFALKMVEPKFTSLNLFNIRLFRLLLPLVVGMYIIVPPQAYFEALSRNLFDGGYWQFWLEYIQPSSELIPQMVHSELGLLTWNHLWFLAYLWCYTLVYLMLKPILICLARLFEQTRANVLVIVIVPIIILTIYGVYLKPIFPKTNALSDDWYNHSIYFSVFIFGYLGASSTRHWRAMITHRKRYLVSALIAYCGIIILINMPQSFDSHLIVKLLVQTWVYANAWLWLLTVVAYAGTYLNQPSKSVTYFNQAILPWYILHQTVTIIFASYLSQYQLVPLFEVGLLIVGTFLGCGLAYEMIKRFRLARLVFGMK